METTPQKTAFAEELRQGVHDAFNSLMVNSYNGSDTPTLKPFPQAFEDLSKNVRGLNGLLEGKKERQLIINSGKTFIQNVSTFFKPKLKWGKKIGLICLVVYLIWKGGTDISIVVEYVEKLFL